MVCKSESARRVFLPPRRPDSHTSHLGSITALTTSVGSPAGEQPLVLVVRRELRRRVREAAEQLRHVALPESKQALLPATRHWLLSGIPMIASTGRKRDCIAMRVSVHIVGAVH